MSQASVLASMFGGFGGGGLRGNDQEDAYYNARLKQYLKEQEEEAYLADSAQYRNVAKALERQILDTPNMTEEEKTHRLTALGALENMNMRTSPGVNSLNDAIQSLMAGVQQSASQTDKQRNYKQARQEGYDGSFMNFVNESEMPSLIKEAQYYQANPDMRQAMDVLRGRDPQRAYDVKSAEQAAVGDSQRKISSEKEAGEFVTKQLESLPNAIFGYQDMIRSADRVHGQLDQIENLIKENPYAQGAVGEWLKTIPATKAMDLDNLIKTVEANNVLKGMDMARSNSPTGATGFGALDKGEREGLATAVAALKQASTPEQFQQAMSDLRTYYDTVRQVAADRWKADAEWNNAKLGVVEGVGRRVSDAPAFKPWKEMQAEKEQAERQKLIDEIKRRRGQ